MITLEEFKKRSEEINNSEMSKVIDFLNSKLEDELNKTSVPYSLSFDIPSTFSETSIRMALIEFEKVGFTVKLNNYMDRQEQVVVNKVVFSGWK